MGCIGNSSGMPPASRTPSRTRRASSRWTRLQGFRSLPDCAMPMTGRPLRSSWGVRPLFMKRSRYSAVMSMRSGLSNQLRERKRRGVWAMVKAAPASAPAGVYPVFVTRAHTTVIGSQEQDQAGDMLGLEPFLETLLRDEVVAAVARVPLLLPRRAHIARHDAADADSVHAQLARQRTRHTFDAGLGGFV